MARKITSVIVLAIIFFSGFLNIALANEGGLNQEFIHSSSLNVAYGVGSLLLILIILAIFLKNKSEKTKLFLFFSIVVLVSFSTLYFLVATIYLNITSTTKGPVHWHADFKIFTCGQENLPPEPSSKLSNKVGTPLFHEHEDRRIHIEGTVGHLEDVSIGRFFEVQGGELAETSFIVPSEDGLKTYNNFDSCAGLPSVWNVFLYQTKDNLVTQTKLTQKQAMDYVISPSGSVPPGDCLIFEFEPAKEKTEKICDLYKIEIEKGNLKIN